MSMLMQCSMCGPLPCKSLIEPFQVSSLGLHVSDRSDKRSRAIIDVNPSKNNTYDPDPVFDGLMTPKAAIVRS